MVEFRDEDLSGSVFQDVDLSGARFSNVHLENATIRGAWGEGLSISGGFDQLMLDGIDVIPLWRAEMVRRHPEFALLPPANACDYRELWPILERQWAETVTRVRALPEELLHERVEGEWSFIETTRHLLFVTDAWLSRAVLAEPAPYDPLGLQHDEAGVLEGVELLGSAARPSLETVLSLRADRMARVREVISGLTDEQLAGDTEVTGPGYPEAGTYAVRRCLGAVVNEEWWHRRFAERDLEVLVGRSSA